MRKLRNGRNPRYQEALNLAETNNELLTEQTDWNYRTSQEMIEVKENLKKLSHGTVDRTERVTDALLQVQARFWSLDSKCKILEHKLEHVTNELKSYVPDHDLFKVEDKDPEPDEEPEPKLTKMQQLRFDFTTKQKGKLH